MKWQNQLHCTLGTRGFFFPRVPTAVGCFGVGQRPKIFSHAGNNLKSCLKPETAHEKSLAHMVKTL